MGQGFQKKHTPFPEGCCSLGVSDIPPGSNFSMRWSTWSRTLNRCSLWHLNFVAPLGLVAFFPGFFDLQNGGRQVYWLVFIVVGESSKRIIR